MDNHLTPDEKSIARSEILFAIVKRGGMAKDVRTPETARNYYQSRVDQLHRIYLKLGGSLSTREILR